jgi:hypothetical protein
MQSGHRRTEMRRRIVPEFDDPRVAIERGLDDAALHAVPASVYDPHLENARICGGVDIVGHDRGNVTRLEGVQIELGFDGDFERPKFKRHKAKGNLQVGVMYPLYFWLSPFAFLLS